MSGKQRRLNLSNKIPMPPEVPLGNLHSSFSSDYPATGFHTRIEDVCLFQIVKTHCCGKVTLAEICQWGGDV